MIQPNSETIRTPKPSVHSGRIASRARGRTARRRLLQCGPRRPGRSERPDRQVKVWPLIEDLRGSPLNELKASVGESLCSATPGRPVSPWLRVASTSPGGDSSSSVAKY